MTCDRALSGVQGPFQFDETAIGQFPWTKTGAVQDIGGTSDVLLTGQRPDVSGCVAWVILLVHGPSGPPRRAAARGCPAGERSCGFQTSGPLLHSVATKLVEYVVASAL